jgi:hypothetical protein
MGVGSGENVLVSCIIIATTNFCATFILRYCQVLEQSTELPEKPALQALHRLQASFAGLLCVAERQH